MADNFRIPVESPWYAAGEDREDKNDHEKHANIADKADDAAGVDFFSNGIDQHLLQRPSHSKKHRSR